MAWREIKFGKPAQQAQAPSKASGGGSLEALTMDELYALAFDGEEEGGEVGPGNEEEGGIVEPPLDTDDGTVVSSGED